MEKTSGSMESNMQQTRVQFDGNIRDLAPEQLKELARELAMEDMHPSHCNYFGACDEAVKFD